MLIVPLKRHVSRTILLHINLILKKGYYACQRVKYRNESCVHGRRTCKSLLGRAVRRGMEVREDEDRGPVAGQGMKLERLMSWSNSQR